MFNITTKKMERTLLRRRFTKDALLGYIVLLQTSVTYALLTSQEALSNSSTRKMELR